MTKTNIFDQTPEPKKHMNLMIPQGLSPPDFSDIKMHDNGFDIPVGGLKPFENP